MLDRAPSQQTKEVPAEVSASDAALEFVRSAAYSGVAETFRGVAQAVDWASGRSDSRPLETTVANAFGAIGIQQPVDKGFGTLAWHMQQLGGAVGMMLPFGLLLGRARSITGAASIGAGEMSMAGTAYGLLRPVANPQESFLLDKAKQGLGDGLIAGTIGVSSPYMRQFAGAGVQRLEASALPSILKNPLLAGLRPEIVQSYVLPRLAAAVPAGFVSAQVEGWKKGNSITLDGTVGEHMYGMAFVSAATGIAERIAMPRAAARVDGVAANDNVVAGTAYGGNVPGLESLGLPPVDRPFAKLAPSNVDHLIVAADNDNALRNNVQRLSDTGAGDKGKTQTKRSASATYSELTGAYDDPGLQRKLFTELVSKYHEGEVPPVEAHKQEVQRLLSENGFYVDGTTAGKLVIVAPKLQMKDATTRTLAPESGNFYEPSGLMFQLDSLPSDPHPAYRVTPVRLTGNADSGWRTAPIDVAQDAILTRGSDGKYLLTGTSMEHENLIERIEQTIRLQLAFTDPGAIKWARQQRSAVRDGRLEVISGDDQAPRNPPATETAESRRPQLSSVFAPEDPMMVELRTEAFKSAMDSLYMSMRRAESPEVAAHMEMTMYGLELLMDNPTVVKADLQRYIQQQITQRATSGGRTMPDQQEVAAAAQEALDLASFLAW